MKKIQIAIDGPASSGKSTVAKIIARNLDLIYLDTGAMYRVATFVALQKETDDAKEIIEFIEKNPISFMNGQKGQEVLMGSENVTEVIRTNEVTNTVFKQNVKEKINFDLNIDTNLIPNQAVSKANLQTTIGNLTSQNSVYTFTDDSFNSDYLLNIPQLDKLKDVVKMSLKGKLDISGELYNKENSMSLNGKSDTLGGTFDFDLKNDKLNANLKDIDVQELSYMLDYSKIFDAKANFVLDYDLLLKKGELVGKLINGHFLPNNFLALLTQVSKFDLSKETYDVFDINSQIDDRVLTSDLIMKSANTQIDIQDSILDLEKKLIEAKINSTIKDKKFIIDVKGETSNPKISLNAKDLLKEKLDKQLEKKRDKIEEKLNKVLGGKAEDEKAKELIDNLKSIVK